MDEDILAQLGPQPRGQHYNFAHKALPLLFFSSPAEIIQLLETRGTEFLDKVWNSLGPETEGADQIDSAGLAVHKAHLTRNLSCVILKLPTPKAMAEAHMVAALHQVPNAESSPQVPEMARYFTLERGYSPDETEHTVFCEWDEFGTHYNMGPGPRPDIDAFIARIAEAIESPPSIEASSNM